MTPTALPFTACTDLEGNPLEDGYLLVRLNTDAKSPDGQLAAGLQVRVPLDDEGSPESGFDFWPNSYLLPSDTVYTVDGYTEEGQWVFSAVITLLPGSGSGFGTAFGSSFGS